MRGKVDKLAILFVSGLFGCGSEDASALTEPVGESLARIERNDEVGESAPLSDEERMTIFLRMMSTIFIERPPEGSTIYARECVVEGWIRYPGKIRSVRVAGRELAFDKGRFRGHIDGLEDGINAVTVDVEEERGVVASPSVIVTVDATPPQISIEEPREGETLESPVLVRGHVDDDSRIDVELCGRTMSLDPDGSFEFLLALEPGPQSIELVVSDSSSESRIVRHVTVRHAAAR